jgi:hypothetical protein
MNRSSEKRMHNSFPAPSRIFLHGVFGRGEGVG